LPDPGPTIDPEGVRQFYLTQYPELLNSNVFGPEMKGDKVVWRFRPVIGEKDDHEEKKVWRRIHWERFHQVMYPFTQQSKGSACRCPGSGSLFPEVQTICVH
jgi:hypothetical protein